MLKALKVFGRISVGLISILAGTSLTPVAAKTIHIRCATDFPPMQPQVVVLKELESIIPNETNGNVKFTVYPLAQLYTTADAIPAMQMGDLEMTIGGFTMSFLFKEIDLICSLPFLFSDESHFIRFQQSTAYREFCGRMEAKGFVPITPLYTMGKGHFFNSKKAVIVPEDLNGLKCSVPPGPIIVEALMLLGSKPVHVPIPEVPAAVETGMVDGTPCLFTAQLAIDFKRLMPYVTTFGNISQYPLGLVVSKKWWSSLEPELQTQLRTIFNNAFEKYWKMSQEIDEQQFSIFKETEGTTISELTEAQRKQWKNKLTPLYNKLMKDPVLKGVIESVEKTRN